MPNYFILLCFFVLLRSFFIGWGILNWGIDLGPDEAQYWTWSQALDWGYYSKPPAIAWQIWLGTQLFGNSEFGVRFGSIVIGFILPLFVYALARACSLSSRSAFWAGMIMAFSPLGFMSSIFATTDAGMVTFWTLGCIVMAHYLSKNESPNYILLGVTIMLGALYKWPIYLLWLMTIPLYRYWNRTLIMGFFISLLGLFPSFIWNSQHDWATFRHVFATVKGETYPAQGSLPILRGNFFDFIAAQTVFIFPVFFVILVFALIGWFKKRKELNPALLFCGYVTISLLGAYTALSLFKKMQGNWCVFAYPTAIILIAWYACEVVNRLRIWLWVGVISSAILCFLVFSGAQYIPLRHNPFKHTLGWENITPILVETGYNPQTDFLFGDKYQMSSLLSFYGPEQKRAYFLNLKGTRKNQFSYWNSMKDNQLGKTGYFMLVESVPYLNKLNPQEYQELLENYFKEVRFLGVHPLIEQNGIMSKGALLFKGIEYNGEEPPEKDLY